MSSSIGDHITKILIIAVGINQPQPSELYSGRFQISIVSFRRSLWMKGHWLYSYVKRTST